MCTVTFIHANGHYFLTSNRDEDIRRAVPLKPVTEMHNGVRLTFPKDPKAGGSWFVVNEYQDVLVLLNGAFVKHHHTGNYRRSRGLVLLDIAAGREPIEAFSAIDLDGIEPFTTVVFSKKELHEVRWDGKEKFIAVADVMQPHIWSSAMLYTPEVIAHREKLFNAFIEKNKQPDSTDIINFHSDNHGDLQDGFVMRRGEILQTLSITQVRLNGEVSMWHEDLRSGEVYRMDN